MKYVLVIQTFLLILVSSCCQGQDNQVLDVKMECYEYYIGDTKFTNTSIIIKNNSSRDILFWLSDNSIPNMTIEEKIKDYFFQVKGDFSLYQMMTENIASFPSAILYVSFIKYLTPKESFSINIISKGILKKEQEMKIENVLVDRINVGEIDSFNNLIDSETLMNFSYKADYICLALEQL